MQDPSTYDVLRSLLIVLQNMTHTTATLARLDGSLSNVQRESAKARKAAIDAVESNASRGSAKANMEISGDYEVEVFEV